MHSEVIARVVLSIKKIHELYVAVVDSINLDAMVSKTEVADADW